MHSSSDEKEKPCICSKCTVRWAWCFLLTLVIADAKQAGANKNLLPNGTFERGAWSWEIETGGVNRITFPKDKDRFGGTCARFDFTGDRWLWLDLAVDVSARLPLKPGKVVKLTFFAKWLSGDNCISAGFNVRGKGDRAWLGSHDHIAVTRIPKDRRWHRVEMFLLLPWFDEKRACLQLKLGAHSDINIGKESFLIDDMNMQVCIAPHQVRLRFEDGTPEDGWGTNLFHISVFVNDAETPLVQFRPGSPMERAFLVEDVGTFMWKHEGAGVRVADGKGHFVYEVPIPCADLSKLTIETEMSGTFLMRVALDDFPFVVACRAPKPIHSHKNCRRRRVQVVTFDDIDAVLVADCELRNGIISLSLVSRTRLERGHRLVWIVDGRAVNEVVLPTVPECGTVRLRFRCEWLHASESWLVPVSACISNAAGVEVSATRGRLSIFNPRLLQRRLSQLEQQSAKLATLLRKASERQIHNYDADIVLTALKCYPSYIKDDFEHGELERVIVALDYLWRSAREAIRDVSYALERGETQPPQPKVSVLRPQIRNGSFYQGDQPILLIGPMRDRIRVSELQTIADFGFNAVELVVAPAWDSPKDYEYYARFLEVAKQRNIAVYVLLSAHYFPKWWAKKYPEITHCGEFCMPWCISSPNLRKLLKAWFERIIPFLRDKPAVLSYCLANEPHYIDTGYCDLCKAKFREWLRKRYRTVEALNKRWRTHFTSFEQVQPITKRRDNPAAYYDWFCFNNYRLTEFFRWERSIIKRLDPRTPIHNELMAWHAFATLNDGIDFEDQLLLVSDLNGCDGGTRWLPRGRYAMDWLNGQAMPYDLMRSIAPSRPIFNSEWHIVTQDDVRIPSAYMRATAWHAAIHGQGGATIWVWLRRYPRQGCPFLARPNIVVTAGKVTRELNRFAKEIALFQRPSRKRHREVCILYATSSLVHDDNYVRTCRSAYEALYFLDTPIGFVTERQAEKGEFDGCKLLIVPIARFATDRCVAGIKKFVRNGGTLVLIGRCLEYNEYGDSRNLPTVMLNGGALGKGKVVRMAAIGIPMDTARAFDRLIDECGVNRPVRCDTWGVVCRSAIDNANRRLVCVLINLTPKRVEAKLTVNLPVRTIRSLFSGHVISERVTLDSLQVELLEMPLR